MCLSNVYYIFQVPSTGEEDSLLVVQSYDDLSRKLWRLEDLPLSITAVQGAHPALRYTQVIRLVLGRTFRTILINGDVLLVIKSFCTT